MVKTFSNVGVMIPPPQLTKILTKTQKMSTKKAKKDRGLIVSHSSKSQKITDYVYILSNGQQLTFKNKEFPVKEPPIQNNGQLLIF